MVQLFGSHLHYSLLLFFKEASLRKELIPPLREFILSYHCFFLSAAETDLFIIILNQGYARPGSSNLQPEVWQTQSNF